MQEEREADMPDKDQRTFLISVCIPTYNRDLLVYGCVRNILQCEDSNLEVVVGDNCSTDKTHSLLASIDDERLFYFRNEVNMGYVNILETIRHAHGSFCFLLSDEDDLIVDKIDELKCLAEVHKDVAAIVTGVEHMAGTTLMFSAGPEAVCQSVLNMPGYISGLVFRRERVMECLDRMCREELFFQLFPHLYAGTLCCMNGGIVLTGSRFVKIGQRIGKTDCEAQKVKTTGMHWEPKSRILQVSGQYKALYDCGLDLSDRQYVGLILMKNYTISSTISFYKIINGDMTSWNMSEEKLKELSDIAKQPRRFWYRMVKKNYREIRSMLEKELLGQSLCKSLMQHPKYVMLYLKGRLKIRLEAMKQL